MAKKLENTDSCIILGGGEFANLIRKYDSEQNFSDEANHWTAIDCMDITAKLVNDKVKSTKLAYSIEEVNEISNEKVTEKTGQLVAIMDVNDDNDLMIINKSGITIRTSVDQIPVQKRATQGVRIINLGKKNDCIGSVCKVTHETESEDGIDAVENSAVTDDNNVIEADNTNNQ